jgi:hypothetical protein
MTKRIAIRSHVRALKERRDKLLNTACTRDECSELMQEVRVINRKLKSLRTHFYG